MNKFYNATNDAVFKKVFTDPNNNDLLTSLLESALERKIKIIKLLPPEKLKKRINLKGKTLDVLIEADGEKINCELNSGYYSSLHRRNAAYIFQTYSEDLDRGEDYNSMNNHIQINFTNYNYKYEIPLLCIYKLIDRKYNKEFIDNLTIYEFNLKKVKELCYNKGEEKYKMIAALSANEEELAELSKGDKIVEKFKEEVVKMNRDRKFANMMSQEEEARKLQNTLMSDARNEGIDQGIKLGMDQGIKQNRIEVAKRMLEKDVDISFISEITGLSEKEIEHLKK